MYRATSWVKNRELDKELFNILIPPNPFHGQVRKMRF